MRVVFMGTPEFAVPVLETLHESGHTVAAVYTQPDSVRGRGKQLLFSPVKEAALRMGLPVLQPERLRGKEVYDELQAFQPDVIVVAAYGQILRKKVLEMPRFGCLNVHASLLPKYRGAAPVPWAIIDGEEETGVTVMQMNEGLDTGDMLMKAAVPIEKDDTADTLLGKLSRLGGPLILKALEDAENGALRPEKQPEESPTPYAKMLEKEMGRADFTLPAAVLEKRIRGFDPYPTVYAWLSGKQLKLYKAEVTEGDAGKTPGEIIGISKRGFTVQCGGDTALLVTEVQPEGKKRMDAPAYLRGARLNTGALLTDHA